MNIEELLIKAGSDSRTVLARFGNNEGLLRRFVVKFPSDPNYDSLREAVEKDDRSAIEICAHTLKGVSANLGFNSLSEKSAVIVNAIRTSQTGDLPSQLSALQEEYEKVVELISQLD